MQKSWGVGQCPAQPLCTMPVHGQSRRNGRCWQPPVPMTRATVPWQGQLNTLAVVAVLLLRVVCGNGLAIVSPPSFVTHSVVASTSYNFYHSSAGDFDNDGKLDVANAEYSLQAAAW